MIIKKIEELENCRKEFIEKNKEEKILIKNYQSNDFGRMIGVIEDCKAVDKFLQIEIGRNFFFITKTNSKIGDGCPYWLSDRTIEELVKEEI